MTGLISIQRFGKITKLNILGIKLSLGKKKRVRKLPKRKENGSYDMNNIIAEYLGRSIDFTGVCIEHGWYPKAEAPGCDLKNATKLMLCWSRRNKDIWDKSSPVPCYVLGCPFMLYRQLHKIEKSPDAKGTIAYPAHSLRECKAVFDIEQYCRQLKSLPEEFQPVTVSLHREDIEYYGLDKVYQQHGFKTVCASLENKPFYQAFYDILKNFKYATSNEPGSYAFHAVEMDIPFFLMGEEPYREEDESESISRISDNQYGALATKLFSTGPKTEISKEQREFVLSEVGFFDKISIKELDKIL